MSCVSQHTLKTHKNVVLLSNKTHYKWTRISMVLFKSTYCSNLFYNTCQIQPFTFTFIHWWQRLPCKVPTAHQEQFGVQYLAQGFFDMQLGEAGIQTSNLRITRRPALPPEPQQPSLYCNGHWMHIVFNCTTDLLNRALINNVYVLCFITLWWLVAYIFTLSKSHLCSYKCLYSLGRPTGFTLGNKTTAKVSKSSAVMNVSNSPSTLLLVLHCLTAVTAL